MVGFCRIAILCGSNCCSLLLQVPLQSPIADDVFARAKPFCVIGVRPMLMLMLVLESRDKDENEVTLLRTSTTTTAMNVAVEKVS